MNLENSFTVSADVETAWETLLDVEAIAHACQGQLSSLLLEMSLRET